MTPKMDHLVLQHVESVTISASLEICEKEW